MATPAKQQRSDSNGRSYSGKQKAPKNYLKCGDVGFFATYSFKEKDSVREIYKLLNEYYQQNVEKVADEPQKEDAEKSDDDITSQLDNEIEKSKEDSRKKTYLFQSVDIEINGCAFIKTEVANYHDIGVHMIRDLFETKVKKTKFTNRLIPIDKVCKAIIEEIVIASEELFDQHFVKEPSTFAINFNKRYNNSIDRDEVITKLAELVSQKNENNKVDLKNPEKTILVEIMKGLCLITVLPDYLKLKKYNLNELSTTNEDENKTDTKTC